MPRRIKGEVGGLNVRAHPHDSATYRRLIKALYDLKRIVNIRGDRSGLITSLGRFSQSDTYVDGVITTFVDIDLDGVWFDTRTMKEASDNEREKIEIPENLRPNSKHFFFRFYFDNHELVFELYGNGDRLTHYSALGFFRDLLDSKEIVKEFGDVKITIINSRGSIDRLFSIPRVTELDIFIERPNSDLWGEDFEEQAEEHLEDKNARSMNVRYKAERGQGIIRDDDLDSLLRASIRNGRAIAKGYGQNGHETVTTDKYPKVVQDRFDTDSFGNFEIFSSLASRFRQTR